MRHVIGLFVPLCWSDFLKRKEGAQLKDVALVWARPLLASLVDAAAEMDPCKLCRVQAMMVQASYADASNAYLRLVYVFVAP
jgi:hypothetical protein